MIIYFLSSNQYKIAEVKKILESNNIEVKAIDYKIDEIQSSDITKIVNDKVLKAFSQISRPLFVEQTGLCLEDFGGIPGGLTQVIWDSLRDKKFCEYFGNRKVRAKTVIAYCDGKDIYNFDGYIDGIIVDKARGNKEFQWDCIFQPNGFDKTFAELGEKKNEISMRKIALDKFKEYLKGIIND